MDAGIHAVLACLWEAAARKPGNVHRHRDHPGLRFADFLASAAAIGPVFSRAAMKPVGRTVLQAIQATRQVVSTNTNLGIVLLLAPLAAVPSDEPLAAGVERILNDLGLEDTRNVFAAIRLACPGGLGQAAAEDVHAEPTLPLRAVMALAADRDLVARQYAHGFREVFQEGLPGLRADLESGLGLEEAIILTHVRFLAQHQDSLIARKRGLEEAAEASRRAQGALQASRAEFPEALRALDTWLCAEGMGRNPGTSADLVTACLFAALREGIMKLPLQVPWSSGWQHG